MSFATTYSLVAIGMYTRKEWPFLFFFLQLQSQAVFLLLLIPFEYIKMHPLQVYTYYIAYLLPCFPFFSSVCVLAIVVRDI